MASEERKKSRVTLLDVARHANVSRATASLVLRKSPLVGNATRLRVEQAMRDLGYVYNIGAARLRVERSQIIGAIVPNLANPFFAELLSGIEEVIGATGKAVILANSGDQVERQDMLLQRMREHGVDGVILCPAAQTSSTLSDQITDWGMPLVQVLRHISLDLDYVGVDYAAGMHQAVDYLASLGHKKIAFAAHGPIHSAYQERVEGFRDAMLARNLDPGIIIRFPTQLGEIANATHLLFDHETRPTAVICFNHVVALGLSAGLHDRGLTIGRDFSLVSFDDVADAEAIRPKLTSVSTGPVTIGEMAARLLVDRIANPGLQPRHVVKDTTLHIRQSCGRPN
ncbi:LacI family transcriptional regulator [Rhizobiaceae bacterium n13]|uniref:LacI family transcriptional regulator n=1 Tax=Ferirhizobium litorale TaxID=2927786 RepID=A0AAE3QIS3_9HYPH|nr:LacI family DNA-binding transcriptional regulator [Fererhizobium litorale]MDI7862664.1 LacI family transcriptional regulator [Fererhizobium litorale]MDI7923853.1 LacI family transcriptional regulator [Fererhizobium litorale]